MNLRFSFVLCGYYVIHRHVYCVGLVGS